MSRPQWFAFGCIILATLGLGLGFTLGGVELLAPVVTIMGIAWLVGVQREWPAVTSLALIFYVACTAVAMWKGFMPGLMLVVLVAALSAWDLVSMSARFHRVKKEGLEAGIEQRHLARLAAVDILGLLLGTAGLLFKARLSFGVEIFLGLVVALGLSQLILRLRRSNS